MKPADTPLLAPLAIVQAFAVQPAQQSTVAQWQQAALAEHAAGRDAGHAAGLPSTYRVLTRWQFGEVGQQPADWCADAAVRPHAGPDACFAHEPMASQADLAQAALQGLMQSLQASRGEAALEAVKQCGAAVYATSGVDENFFQSSISRLVCGMGMSRVPHFGVAQWQGASWIGAMDIIDALGAEREGAQSALLVCAEKWPAPFPRVLSLPAVLGDGAAALWIERASADLQQPALVCLDTVMRSGAPYVAMPEAHTDQAGRQTLPDVDRARILADARQLMAELLRRHALEAGDIDGWLPCGLGRDWDRALQDNLGLEWLGGGKAWDAETPGYLCAASGPVFIERLLAAMSAGRIRDGARFLGWGMSLGGTVGVALLEARCPQVRVPQPASPQGAPA